MVERRDTHVKFSTKPIVGLAVGAGLLVAAPMVTAQSGGSYGGGSYGGDSCGGDLKVIGLTQDAKLIRFEDDSALNQVSIQSPANAGNLAATGKLGVNTDATIGSDVYPTIRNGTKVTGIAIPLNQL